MDSIRRLWDGVMKANEGQHRPSLTPGEQTYHQSSPSIAQQDLADEFATPPPTDLETSILTSPTVLQQFDEDTRVGYCSDLLTQAHTKAMSNAELVAAYARDLASKYPEGETKTIPPTQRMKDSTPSFTLNRFVATVADAWETPGNTFQQGTGNFMNRLSSLDRIDLNKRPRSPSPLPTRDEQPAAPPKSNIKSNRMIQKERRRRNL
jgi:hypothetical protein